MAKKKPKRPASPAPAPVPAAAAPLAAPPKFAESATSPDGRLVAKLIVTNDFHGMFHEDMSWFIEVRDTADSELVYSTGRSWSGYVDDDDDHRATGSYVYGLAFDANGNLLIGERGGEEKVALPPPPRIPRGVVLSACAAALRAAWPDRAEILADGIETLLWPRAGRCLLCAFTRDGFAPACDRCRALVRRRVAAATPPDPAMVLSETIRALRSASTPAERLDEIVSFLEERTAAIPPAGPCALCQKPFASPDPLDLHSPPGRVCAGCLRAIAADRPAPA